jgi:hypothetical protein
MHEVLYETVMKCEYPLSRGMWNLFLSFPETARICMEITTLGSIHKEHLRPAGLLDVLISNYAYDGTILSNF